jgi:hypothetical protein
LRRRVFRKVRQMARHLCAVQPLDKKRRMGTGRRQAPTEKRSRSEDSFAGFDIGQGTPRRSRGIKKTESRR